MKRLTIILLLGTLFEISCTPSNQTNPNTKPDSNTSQLDSSTLTRRFPGEVQGEVDKWVYDDQGRLVAIYSFNTDTTSVVISTYDTIQIFYHGTDTIPYSLSEPEYDGNTKYVDTHYFQFDNSQRVTVDSMISTGPTTINEVTHFEYASDYVKRITKYGIDTMFFDENNNIVKYVESGYPQYYTASTYANPFNFPGTGNIAVTEYYGRATSVGLPFLPAQIKYPDGSGFGFINYTWATDDKGRVISGVGTSTGSYQVTEICTVAYKN
ncbi:MAG TPA: hypothetical protein VG890_01125 [Puia sp.]|nr:hypothetical protein [Puia sp.]